MSELKQRHTEVMKQQTPTQPMPNQNEGECDDGAI